MKEANSQSRDQSLAIASESGIKSLYSGNRVAASYLKERSASELMRLLSDRQVRTVQRVMRATEPHRTLEIAPGPGRITRSLDAAGELVCLEFNQEMINEGRRWCGDHVQWVRGDAFDLPFEQDAFDFAYSFRFVRHFQRADRDRLYAQIARVIQPDGLFVMDAVNAVVSRPLRDANPECFPVYDVLYADEGELRNELACAGFEVIHIEPVHTCFPIQYQIQVLVGPRSRWLCRRMIRLLERLRRGPALEWIVTCRRTG